MRLAIKDAVEYFTKRCSATSHSTSEATAASAGNIPHKSSSSSPSSSSPSSSCYLPSSTAAASNILGYGKAEYLHSHFYVNIYNENEKKLLENMWLAPVLQIGEVVAGDEKLFHYTAHHMNTRTVPQKKDVCVSFDLFIFVYLLPIIQTH